MDFTPPRAPFPAPPIPAPPLPAPPLPVPAQAAGHMDDDSDDPDDPDDFHAKMKVQEPSYFGAKEFAYRVYKQECTGLAPAKNPGDSTEMPPYLCEPSGHLRTLSVHCGHAKQTYEEGAKVKYKMIDGAVGGFVFNLPYKGQYAESHALKMMKGWGVSQPDRTQEIRVVLQHFAKDTDPTKPWLHATRWRLGTFEPWYFFRLGKFNKVLLIKQGLEPKKSNQVFEWLFGRNSNAIRKKRAQTQQTECLREKIEALMSAQKQLEGHIQKLQQTNFRNQTEKCNLNKEISELQRGNEAQQDQINALTDIALTQMRRR